MNNRLKPFSLSTSISESDRSGDIGKLFKDLNMSNDFDDFDFKLMYNHLGFDIHHTTGNHGSSITLEFVDKNDETKHKFSLLSFDTLNQVGVRDTKDQLPFFKMLHYLVNESNDKNFIKKCHDHWYEYYGRELHGDF